MAPLATNVAWAKIERNAALGVHGRLQERTVEPLLSIMLIALQPYNSLTRSAA